jgi:hypothetical protein
VECDGGRLQVRGRTFGSSHSNIVLLKATEHAIISENNGAQGVQISNEIADKALICCNEPYQPAARRRRQTKLEALTALSKTFSVRDLAEGRFLIPRQQMRGEKRDK